MPLVDEIPDLRTYEAARIVATSGGSEPLYYRIFEGYFEDIEQLQSSMATPQGQAAASDIPNVATGVRTSWPRASRPRARARHRAPTKEQLRQVMEDEAIAGEGEGVLDEEPPTRTG